MKKTVEDPRIQEIFAKIGKSAIYTTFLGSGEASFVLKVLTDDGTFALKAAQYPERKDKVLNEVNFRNFFIKHGISCIPAPVYSDSEIYPNGAVIYEYAKGTPIVFRGNVDAIKRFAHIIAEIHQKKYEIIDQGYRQIAQINQNLRYTIDKLTNNYPHLVNSTISSAFSKGLDEFMDLLKKNKLSMPLGINAQLHGDLSNNFVIDSDDKIWLVDWENSEYGDIAEELCFFLYMNNILPKSRSIFFQEYQKAFDITQKIHFDDIAEIYFASYPIFDICWGMDQMGTKLKNKLESSFHKLNDLDVSARDWSRFYSDSTSSLMINGIKELRRTLTGTGD